jgi:hypothetical protein
MNTRYYDKFPSRSPRLAVERKGFEGWVCCIQGDTCRGEIRKVIETTIEVPSSSRWRCHSVQGGAEHSTRSLTTLLRSRDRTGN